jgi:hypothetical protein
MSWINKLFHNFKEKNLSNKQLFTKNEIREHTLTWHAIKNTLTSLNGIINESEQTKILKRGSLSVKESRWIFKVLSGIDQGREYIAITQEIRVGRHPENSILLRDPKVSRFHAIIYYKGTRLILEDLGSTNGTRVNGEIIIKKRTLSSGDLIKIGETLIRVSLVKD